jgi:hypothetical protein
MDETLLRPFPSLWKEPIRLFAGEEIHDAPREVTECSIEPSGSLAAATDSLGRILLIDLCMKQMIRIFKGYRDASVCWLFSERIGATGKPSLHMAIHSKQRRTLEIYRMRHGPLEKVTQTHRVSELVLCLHASASLSASSTCLLCSGATLDSIVLGTSFCPTEEKGQATISSSKATGPSQRSVALRLQYLRQLLSTEAVQFGEEDVRHALKAITSLSDLCTALDLLSVSSLLEDKLAIQGSRFQRDAIAHCRNVLTETIATNSSSSLNPALRKLSVKIQYHSQVRRAILDFTALTVLNNFPVVHS